MVKAEVHKNKHKLLQIHCMTACFCVGNIMTCINNPGRGVIFGMITAYRGRGGGTLDLGLSLLYTIM